MLRNKINFCLCGKEVSMGLTFLDFFAGVGGFRRGMEQAGHTCLGHCEWDKFANKSYEAIHDVKEYEWFGKDIRDVRANELPKSDVWCFGFPCQDISVAGKQLGFDGKRSSLFFTVTRLVRNTEEESRPKYLFIENVKNLFSVNGGTDFLKLLIELDEIGYDAEWQLLNTKNFGLPQNRERVFIIGHLRGGSGRKVFPIGGSNEKTIKQLIGGSQGNRVYDSEGISVSLSANGGGQGAKTGLYLIGNINPSSKGMNGNVYDSRGIAPTLTTNKGEGSKILVRAVLTPDREEKRQNGRRIKEDGEPMFTLTAQDRHGVMLNGCRIRRLTPKECWRLQGWEDIDYEKAAKVCSDSQLYKQAGNGVSIPVIRAIAERLE